MEPPFTIHHSPFTINIFKGGALGDFLLTLPIIAAIRRRYPRSRIELVTSPERSFLVQELVDRVIPIWQREASAPYCNPADDPEASSGRGGADIMIVISQAKLEAPRSLRPGTRFFSVPSFPRPGDRIHVTDFLFRALSEAGLDLPRIIFQFSPSKTIVAEAQEFLTSHFPLLTPHLLFAVHPGSGSRLKNWPAQNYASLILWLKRRLKAEVAVLGGEADEEVLRNVKEGTGPGAAVFLTNLPLPLAAGVINHCRCYIGNDSGITHLAAMMGVPTVALFGPSDPVVWAPRGERVELISAAVSCSPCPPARRRECPDNVCLKAIHLNEVQSRIENLPPGVSVF